MCGDQKQLFGSANLQLAGRISCIPLLLPKFNFGSIFRKFENSKIRSFIGKSFRQKIFLICYNTNMSRITLLILAVKNDDSPKFSFYLLVYNAVYLYCAVKDVYLFDIYYFTSFFFSPFNFILSYYIV